VRFILVNGRTPCAHAVCVMCEKPIAAGYLREIGTHLTYCDHDCYADHCNSVTQLLEGRASATRFSAQGRHAAERTSQ
jgi:hypothetical protein